MQVTEPRWNRRWSPWAHNMATTKCNAERSRGLASDSRFLLAPSLAAIHKHTISTQATFPIIHLRNKHAYTTANASQVFTRYAAYGLNAFRRRSHTHARMCNAPYPPPSPSSAAPSPYVFRTCTRSPVPWDTKENVSPRSVRAIRDVTMSVTSLPEYPARTVRRKLGR